MKKSLTAKNKLFLTIAVILASSYAILFLSSILSIQRFTNEEIAKDLQSSLRFAKTQFNARPELVLEALKLPVSSANVQRLFVNSDARGLQEAADRWAKSLDFLDMLTVFDARQNLFVRNNGKTSSSSFLRGQLLNSLFERRQPIITTELVTYEQYCQEVSVEACQALQGHKDIMVQLILLPVVDQEGRVLGAVVAGDDVNRAPHLPYAQQKVFGKSVEMLITQMGERIASTMSVFEGLPTNLDERVVRSLQAGFSFKGTATLQGREYEMIAEPLHNHKGEFIGSIAVALAKSQFGSIRHENFRNLLLCGAVSISLIFMLAYFFAWQFTLPLRRFVDAVKAIAAGDYSIMIPESGSLEFRTLAETINSMTKALSERDSIIVEKNRELLLLNSQLEARVTERSEQLELEAGIHKAIIKSLMDGLIVTDSQQIIIQLNTAAANLLGREVAGLVSEPLVRLCRLPGLSGLEKLFINEPSGSTCAAKQVIVLEYKRRHLRFAVTELLDDNGSYRGLLLGIRDVTADDEIDRLKSDFIAKISHELKTPLTSMKGSLQFVLKKGKWLTGVEREMLGVCFRNTERLIVLIANILELSKIEAGQITFAMRPLQIGEVILYSLEEVKGAALHKNISLVNEIGLDLPKVYGDSDRLGQVLTSLLSNAIKFSPKDTVVTLSAQVSDGFIAVAVADGGEEIPEKDREKLFSKFQQVGLPEEGNSSSSGLSLAICKVIMERHGGMIYHTTGASGGNVFTFWVPLYGADNGKG
jgi:two-component system, OmpR family, sensor histidine kinase VicK